MSRDYYDEAPVKLDDDFSNVIIVDNIPVVPMEKFEKLLGVIRKIFSAFGNIREDGFYLPVDGTPQKTCGYAFIEYETAEEAKKAATEADHKRLDANHTLRVNIYTDYDKFTSMSTDYVEPKVSDYEVKGNLQSWLLDESLRDQFVLRYAQETQIYWNDPLKKINDNCRTYKYGGEREKEKNKTWTESYVQFSSRGSYLATFHQQGIVVWGGDNFDKLMRFGHPNVTHIDFSPKEKYLVTSNGIEGPECIIVWDVRTGKKLRSFEKGEASAWPVFQWSYDDKYLARVNDKGIAVYETPSMNLLDKKSIPITGIKDICWSPSDHILSYWIPEADQKPVNVGLIRIPSKEIVRDRHLYGVIDLKMYWQDQGEYFTIRLNKKKTKSGKKIVTSFEIFRLKEKSIPVDVLELDDQVVDVAWESKGNRLAVIHGEGASKNNVSIYQVSNKQTKLLKTFDNRSATNLYWSPFGSHLVTFSSGLSESQLEFFDVDALESLGVQTHSKFAQVEWDPSGRYVMTTVVQPMGKTDYRLATETGYRLWSMQGQLLATVAIENLYQFMWRPRPPTLLSPEQVQDVKKSLKDKYWRKFESEDDEIRKSQLSGRAKEREELRQKWRQYRQEKEKDYQQERLLRAELRDGIVSDDENDYIVTEQWVEEEISREEQVIGEEPNLYA